MGWKTYAVGTWLKLLWNAFHPSPWQWVSNETLRTAEAVSVGPIFFPVQPIYFKFMHLLN